MLKRRSSLDFVGKRYAMLLAKSKANTSCDQHLAGKRRASFSLRGDAKASDSTHFADDSSLLLLDGNNFKKVFG